MSNQNKRERLVDSAATLFHRHGMSATSLADIAKHADIPIGNVYYYFKTKEELALAALACRREQFTKLYDTLQENLADPRQRLIEISRHYESLREEYAKYGCPIGTMIETAEAEGESVMQAAAHVFEDFVQWAQEQFRQLGHSDNARRYAISLMAAIQGASIMAKSFKNPEIISDEVARVVVWLESLPNRKIPMGKAGMRAPQPSSSDAA
jgi:AcrR family transcriptional regulator